MERRGFLAAISSCIPAFLIPWRGRQNDVPEESLVEKENPWINQDVGQYRPQEDSWVSEQFVPSAGELAEFKRGYRGNRYPPPVSLKPSSVLIQVDHGLLRWDGPTDQKRYSRAPWIVLEHTFDLDGGTHKLIVDQIMPCREYKFEPIEGSRDSKWTRENHGTEMCRVMELDLADPYQLLLADLLVRGLIDSGVIDDRSFISSWNQAIIDSQNFQFTRDDGDPDAPVKFIADPTLRRLIAERFQSWPPLESKRGFREAGRGFVRRRYLPDQ